MNTAKLGWYLIKPQAPIPQAKALFHSGLSAHPLKNRT